LEKIISMALEKDRDRRYQHGSEIRCELQELRGVAAQAPPPLATSTSQIGPLAPSIARTSSLVKNAGWLDREQATPQARTRRLLLL